MKLPINYSVKNPEKKSLKLETLAIKNAKDQYNKLHPVSAPIYLSLQPMNAVKTAVMQKDLFMVGTTIPIEGC